MFCPECGKEIPDDSVFCPECGARIKCAGLKGPAHFMTQIFIVMFLLINDHSSQKSSSKVLFRTLHMEIHRLIVGL